VREWRAQTRLKQRTVTVGSVEVPIASFDSASAHVVHALSTAGRAHPTSVFVQLQLYPIENEYEPHADGGDHRPIVQLEVWNLYSHLVSSVVEIRGQGADGPSPQTS
jgi:hypothetical protein